MELREDVANVPSPAPATIIVRGVIPISCTATDISEQGATLRVASVFGVSDVFDLVIGEKRQQCRVIGKTANKLTVLFQS
jgi:hypothetical protein